MRKTYKKKTRKSNTRKMKGGSSDGFTMIGYLDKSPNFSYIDQRYIHTRYIPSLLAQPIFIPNYFYLEIPENSGSIPQQNREKLFPQYNHGDYFKTQAPLFINNNPYSQVNNISVILFLNIIYKLGFRGLDLKEMIKFCDFVDENGIKLTYKDFETDYAKIFEPGYFDANQEYSRYRHIVDIVYKYPGLFKDIPDEKYQQLITILKQKYPNQYK